MPRYVIAGNGNAIHVDANPLGSGGQGEVFRATFEGTSYALKVYHPNMGTPEQRRALERLIEKGPPAPYFLWPLHLVDDTTERRWGYLMGLREPRFRTTEDLMARRVSSTFRALINASQRLSEAFLRLHSKGLCYRDISFGNVFLDPSTGDVRICDNDNVDVSGSAPGGVLGTPRFMAPEVVRAEASPSDMTDRYSLAVLLFHLLMGGHPLDGAREAKVKCLDLPAMNQLYGTHPLYIFDPKDSSNSPVQGIHDNPLTFRTLYPAFLLQAFERSFTEGLRVPQNRIRESEWRKLFARARDLVTNCRHCRAQGFFDPDAAGSSRSCWRCQRSQVTPVVMRFKDSLVVLQPDVELFAHHLLQDPYNYEEPLAKVTQHPTDPGLLGLKNLTAEKWTFTKSDGTTVDVPPDRNAPLVNGNRIHFGPIAGDVVAP